MAISYLVGDLVRLAVEGNFNVVVHGVNCQHTMNSGVAKALRDVWPQVYEADLSFGTKGDVLKLGYYTQAYCDLPSRSRIAVINAYIQLNYGYDGARYVEYCAIANVFNRLAAHYRGVAAHPVIGIPRIGCGRAGGDWSLVSRIIDRAMPEFDIRVVDLPEPEIWQGRQL